MMVSIWYVFWAFCAGCVCGFFAGGCVFNNPQQTNKIYANSNRMPEDEARKLKERLTVLKRDI
jgi:hypothetical protein